MALDSLMKGAGCGSSQGVRPLPKFCAESLTSTAVVAWGRCDWGLAAYPTFPRSMDLAPRRRPWVAVSVGIFSTGPAGKGCVANTSSTRDCRSWQGSDFFFGRDPRDPILASKSGFSCPACPLSK